MNTIYCITFVIVLKKEPQKVFTLNICALENSIFRFYLLQLLELSFDTSASWYPYSPLTPSRLVKIIYTFAAKQNHNVLLCLDDQISNYTVVRRCLPFILNLNMFQMTG
jgi:hypothetical protein